VRREQVTGQAPRSVEEPGGVTLGVGQFKADAIRLLTLAAGEEFDNRVQLRLHCVDHLGIGTLRMHTSHARPHSATNVRKYATLTAAWGCCPSDFSTAWVMRWASSLSS
jgi:hypothetical protein